MKIILILVKILILFIVIIIIHRYATLLNKSKKQPQKSISEQKLQDKYNVMEDIKLEKTAKYNDKTHYKALENNIYECIKCPDDEKYRMSISYTLKDNNTNNQYPLEDILDKYFLYVSDFYEDYNKPKSNKFLIELSGNLDDLLKAQEIIGKKVYNKDIMEDGKIKTELIIQ